MKAVLQSGFQRRRIAIWAAAVGVVIVLGAIVVVRFVGPNNRTANNKIVAKPTPSVESTPRPVGVRNGVRVGNVENASGNGNRPALPKTTSSTTTLSKAEFERLTAEYQSLAAELETETAAYRASIPIHDKFRKTYAERVYPFLEAGVLASTALEVLQSEAPELVKNSKYKDDPETEKQLLTVLAAAFGRSFAEVLVESEESRLELTKQDKQLLLRYCAFLAEYSDPEVDPIDYEIPFENGSVEAYQFESRLQIRGFEYTQLLMRILKRSRPPELVEKQRRLSQMYNAIQKGTPADLVGNLPPRYRDAYERWWTGQVIEMGKSYEAMRKSLEESGLITP